MKYIKEYNENLDKFDPEVIKIISECLNSLNIYKREDMQSIIDDSFNNIEIKWLDLGDEFNDISIGTERCNSSDVVGKNLNGDNLGLI